MQDVPTDLVAAGYAALCDFFSGQSDKDPRLDQSFSRSFKQDGPQKSQKSSNQKKRTADATGICHGNTIRRCVPRRRLQIRLVELFHFRLCVCFCAFLSVHVQCAMHVYWHLVFVELRQNPASPTREEPANDSIDSIVISDTEEPPVDEVAFL